MSKDEKTKIKVSETDDRAKKSKHATELEHARNQTAMYLGGKATLETDEYIMENDRIVSKRLRLSPACLKCIDEIIVNAIDQWVETKGNTDIWISYDSKTGDVEVKNTGSCVGVFMTKTCHGKPIYNPQLLFGEFRSSTHYDLSEESTTGGVNGLGATLTNSFSTEFQIETVDPKYKIKYVQSWGNCLAEVDEPEISESTEKPYTKVGFLLNFKDFGMDGRPELLEQLGHMVYMRAVHTAVYISPRTVYWNGKPVQICTMNQLATRFVDQKDVRLVEFDMTNSKGYTWRVALAPKDNNNGLEHITLVNGIYVKNGGSHVDHLIDQILDYVKPLVLKMAKDDKARFLKQNVLKHIFMLMTGSINRPTFTGQRKDMIQMDTKDFAEFKIPKVYLEAFWQSLKPFIEFDAIAKTMDEKPKKKKRVKAKKYEPAHLEGGPRSKECSLFIAEGDTAFGVIDDGITSNKAALGFQRYGIFSIQGVPVNVRREVKFKVNPKTGEKVKIRSAKLKGNERFNALVEVLGLDYTKTYETSDERDTLRYGHAIIATDQDEDGRGNIASLIVGDFIVLWPALIKHGFLQFIITPIVRAYHKKGTVKVQEFYTESDYHAWTKKQANAGDYEIVYYKGLGSHSDQEVVKMFSRWPEFLRTYALDADYETTAEIYLGKESDARKKVLVVPPEGTEEEYYDEKGELAVTDHFNTSTKSFQIYNISRHIPHEVDGMLPSKRKVLAGARRRFRAKNERLKVYQLGGYVIEKMNFHHGDASLSQSIIHMAQCYKGAREFPFLRALSNFGNRKKGGTNAGQPRYIFTKLNAPLVNAMFPAIDDYLLDYTFDDGKRGEPKFYVPVVPLAVLESYKSPGHGWAATIWARDFADIVRWTRESIAKGEPMDRKEDFRISDWYMRHQLKYVKGVLNSIGTYEKTGENTIRVTELPMKIWNVHFTDGNPDVKNSTGIKDDPNITDVRDNSDANNIQIDIRFKPKFLAELKEKHNEKKSDTDYIVAYLDLKQSLKPNLSLMGSHGAVTEYADYHAIAKNWFVVRKRYYQLRVERMSIIMRLKILMIENQIRFAQNRHNYKINKVKRAEQTRIVQEEKYQPIDHKLLAEPGYTEVGKLEEMILRGPDAGYSYLLRMTSEDLADEGIEELQKKIKDLQTDHAELTAKDVFPGAKLWLHELEKLEEVVMKGRREGWEAWDVKPKW